MVKKDCPFERLIAMTGKLADVEEWRGHLLVQDGLLRGGKLNELLVLLCRSLSIGKAQCILQLLIPVIDSNRKSY